MKSKNIHLLPTDKPSRLRFFNNKLCLCIIPYIGGKDKQNIYITSDEEIKEGDWCLGVTNELMQVTQKSLDIVKPLLVKPNWEKIILTTDQDLIKDGVQPIPDEFLEWFCKNSSYEWVDVKSLKTIPALQLTGNNHCMYQLIVPKEEESDYNGKQEIKWISENQSCKQIDSCYNSLSKKCICPKEEPKQDIIMELQKDPLLKDFDNQVNKKISFLKQKQKTLEESTLTPIENKLIEEAKIVWEEQHPNPIEMALFGFKWQQEQDNKLYSEEEVKEILRSYADWSINGDCTYYEWFEQFKKK